MKIHSRAQYWLMRVVPLLLVTLAWPGVIAGQSVTTPELAVGAIPADLRLDGVLDELAWATVDSIANLTQIEPREGGAPTGRTVVRVLANEDAIILGVQAHYTDPSGIVSTAKARDASLQREDYIKVAFDTFRDGRTGYLFAVNPAGARYDALVGDAGESENANWDVPWEAAVARTPYGWSTEIRIPVRSLIFKRGLDAWGFNVERRTERLQEVSRWAGARRDYRVGQTSRAGLLTNLPRFDLGLGLAVRPALTAGVGRPALGRATEAEGEPSLDVTQRIGANLLASLTFNTDFAETEVDTRQTNLTRFPLFFPEKRTFFLEGADIFEFGLGLGGRNVDIQPFFSRRIGLYQGVEVPLEVGTKLNGRIGRSNVGALVARTGGVEGLVPGSAMGVVRVKQNVLRESSVGVLGTFGDPLGRDDSWTAGADFTYQTSRFRGDKNFLIGGWGLAVDRADLSGDKTATGFKIDYPNDDWDIALNYKRLGDGFDPSLGFAPRRGVHILNAGINHRARPGWLRTRNMYYELIPRLVTDLGGEWESYRVFTAPINWRFESGERFEFNWVPEGERLEKPFEIADGVVIPVGAYHWTRWRLEGDVAPKRPISGRLTWWFGSFYTGSLDQIQGTLAWKPSALWNLELVGQRNLGRLEEGSFTQDVIGTRVRLNVSPDLQFNSLVQYDNETESVGTNTRLRWTFHPLGELFVVYNHNLRELAPDLRPYDRQWRLDSNQLLVKVQYLLQY